MYSIICFNYSYDIIKTYMLLLNYILNLNYNANKNNGFNIIYLQETYYNYL